MAKSREISVTKTIYFSYVKTPALINSSEPEFLSGFIRTTYANSPFHSFLRYFTTSTLVARYAKNKLKTSVRPKLHTANINRE